jgi:hypothetical protein
LGGRGLRQQDAKYDDGAVASASDGVSRRTGIERIAVTAGGRAMITVAAEEPSNETARLKVTIATPLISTPC